MTAVKPVLDAYLEMNIVLGLSAVIWVIARAALARTSLRGGYIAQLRAFKVLCLCVLASPLLAWREPVYIVAGLAGVLAFALLLMQPLLIG